MTKPRYGQGWPNGEVPDALRHAMDDYSAQGPSPDHLDRMLQSIHQVGATAPAPNLEPSGWSVWSTPKLWLCAGMLAFGFGLAARPLWQRGTAPVQQASGAQAVGVGEPPIARPAERYLPKVTVLAQAQELDSPTRTSLNSSSANRRPRPAPRTEVVESVVGAASPKLSAPSPVDPVAELALLRRVRVALNRQRAAQALALTEEHRSAFATGTFAQERELLAIESLVALKRQKDAERRAQAFRTRFPNSPHALRVDTLLATPAGGQ